MFPSGQRGQTVNLLTMSTVVRIHPLPPKRLAKASRFFHFLLHSQSIFAKVRSKAGGIVVKRINRVLVIGSNGAGKSTFARSLAEKTTLPLIHLDQIHWRGNWERRPAAEFEAIVFSEAQKSKWIMDGNNINSLHQRLPLADTVFWFDFPPVVCFCNILKRIHAYYGKVRPDMPDQCVEGLSFRFFCYAWTFNRNNRSRILALLAANPHLTVVHFTNRHRVKNYLENL